MALRDDMNNPFTITKAIDFNDDEILEYWVNMPTTNSDRPDLTRPTSPMPIYLLGGKGSGKTHLMRYHSFRLQALRFAEEGLDVRAGITKDGYVGIYLRCNGLNSGRFSGKGQPEERWCEIFAYYIELWLAQHVLEIGMKLNLGKDENEEPSLCAAITSLFDRPLFGDSVTEIGQLIHQIEKERNELDFQINNCVMTDNINKEILTTRGKLVFGIPRIFQRRYKFLEHVSFIYAIDEFETLSDSQQKLFNSFVRDRELPTTFRIGVRLYGVKTYETDSDQEENIEDSEFERIVLDEEFRKAKRSYARFARRLADKRFSAAAKSADSQLPHSGSFRDWSRIFEELDEGWASSLYLDMVGRVESSERRHFKDLREKLDKANLNKVDEVIDLLSVPRYPMLEKVNLLMLYQALVRRRGHLKEARHIQMQCRNFLKNKEGNQFGSALEHYGSDLAAQLRRENGKKHYYLGLNTFIAMSAGLPRALLTTLRSVFDWSTYNGEDPLRSGFISIDAQYRGVRDASEWFFNSMRKAGDDGFLVQTTVERLAELFRINRFADRPAECSLNSFSVAQHELSKESRRILTYSENRSFLIRISGGQFHKNSKQVHLKYQIHPMLCPRWQLPIGRRGALSLSGERANAIFENERYKDFEEILKAFRRRRTFPQVGEQAEDSSTSAAPQQQRLFR